MKELFLAVLDEDGGAKSEIAAEKLNARTKFAVVFDVAVRAMIVKQHPCPGACNVDLAIAVDFTKRIFPFIVLAGVTLRPLPINLFFFRPDARIGKDDLNAAGITVFKIAVLVDDTQLPKALFGGNLFVSVFQILPFDMCDIRIYSIGRKAIGGLSNFVFVSENAHLAMDNPMFRIVDLSVGNILQSVFSIFDDVL